MVPLEKNAEYLSNIKVSAVIPAKNEAAAIGNVLREIFALSVVDEVLVIDDGSTDQTAEIARAEGARVISHPYSMGNGAAIKAGARAATGDILVFMDGDGQHSPKDISRLLKQLHQGLDMVVGARTAGSQASFGRGVANRIYNRLASYMTGQKIEDLTSGFRAVKAYKFRQFLYLLPNGFSYPTTSTMAFFRAGYKVGYIPIRAAKRVGKSHIKPLQDGVRFLLIIFKIGTLYSPLKVFVPISFLVFFTGLSYYGYTYFTSGQFTNMSALMFTTSLVVFMVGLVSEQITALMYRDSD
ncbi:glycosyltransferase family 2 protein [Marinobacter mobilis]|uniref:Glycosyltransferase involved in cell wall bisynthesis n=1 Tax=Marinobacter mobilis TaxID=488533 RepID=A0A1H2TJ34_9GAMM|nr:glycosyltransferase family 2 protein [Marinobacter mobilis]SDW43882.1 Glycosyltransferase involved in cell wall bisynthesis [Marinobacter mobilis]